MCQVDGIRVTPPNPKSVRCETKKGKEKGKKERKEKKKRGKEDPASSRSSAFER